MQRHWTDFVFVWTCILFTQESEKLHYGLWQLRRAITPAPLKIRARYLHQTGGSRGRAIEWCPLNLLQSTLVAMATNHRYLNTKLAITRLVWEIRPPFLHLGGGYRESANLTVLLKFAPGQPLLPWQRKLENFYSKLAITRLVWEIRPPFLHLRGLSGSANLTVLLKFAPDQPLLPWQRKFENFNRKLAITHLRREIRPLFVHLGGVIGVGKFNCAIEICARPTPVAMATKIWKF